MPTRAELLQQARLTRERASQARRLADGIRDDDRVRMIEFAKELEGKAGTLEREAADMVPPVVTQPQEQSR